MTGTILQNAVNAAMRSSDPDEIVEPIKAAVIQEIETLDPTAKITKTDYFNHSFAPDLVLSWGDKQDREVYLRYSLRSTEAGHDISLLGRTGPVFLSLDSAHDDNDTYARLDEEVLQSPNTLVTNAPAIDGFNPERTTDSEDSVAFPLLGMFRQNVVRGGRGILISDTASQIQTAPQSDDLASDLEYIRIFEATAERLFREDAAFRLVRAANLVRIARSGEVAALGIVRDDDQQEPLADYGGSLDNDELKVLLPYLLQRARSINDRRFWQYLGGMMTLRQVEQLADELGDLDLASLVKASLRRWRASRAILTYNSDAVDDEVPAAWSIRSKMLCASAGVWNVHFTTHKRRRGGRQDSLPVRWEEVRPLLELSNVSSVDLEGVIRRVRISADDGSSVLEDIDMIQENIDDEFRVRLVELHPSVEDSSDVEVDFRYLTAEGTNVPIDDLAKASFDLLALHYPISGEDRSILLDSY